MLRFVAQRAVGLIITMFVVSIMVFILMQLPPGDYADRYVFRKYSGSGQTVTESDVQNIRHSLGLDRPAWQQYTSWVGGIVLHFDFGPSFAFETSVNNVLTDKIWITMGLVLGALLVTYAIAIPVGLYAAVHRRSPVDYGLTVMSYVGLAIPNFLLALVLLYFAATRLGTNVGGIFSPEYQDAPLSVGKLVDFLRHMWIPAVVLAWSAIALQLQTVRATMSDELNKLYVTAARARGLSERRLLLKYPARQSLNPVVATIGFDINRIFSELPIVALVLGLSELGQLLIQAFLDQDMFVAGAILLLLTFIIVVANFFSDILLAYLDPRVRLEA